MKDKTTLSKSLDRFVLEQMMEILDQIYVVSDKQETYTNLVIKINELGKKLYRNESN